MIQLSSNKNDWASFTWQAKYLLNDTGAGPSSNRVRPSTANSSPPRIVERILKVLVFLWLLSMCISARAHTIGAMSVGHPETVYITYNARTEAGGISDALENCRKLAREEGVDPGGCAVQFNSKLPGWHAFACGQTACGFSYGQRTSAAAITEARKACEKDFPRQCSKGVTVSVEDKMTTKYSAQQEGGQCSPPAGQRLEYEDNCINGSCVRTFSNGCKKRFEAPYCWNQLQQKFEWMPNGCQ